MKSAIAQRLKRRNYYQRGLRIKMISVICVYNNEDKFQSQLLSSLESQSCDYEQIALNNCDGRFSSAAEAYNYAAGKAKGDILIFSHQDVVLKTDSELEQFGSYISSLNKGAIVGAVGVIEKDHKYYSDFTSGGEYNKTRIFELREPLEVSTVDECIFGMLKSTWELYRFNEKICNSWDLYAVEICLNARKHHNHVYVAPLQFHHFSLGKISITYMKCMKKLAAHYRKDFKYIWTTCYKVYTNRFYMECLYLAWCLNRILRRRSLGADGSLNE